MLLRHRFNETNNTSATRSLEAYRIANTMHNGSRQSLVQHIFLLLRGFMRERGGTGIFNPVAVVALVSWRKMFYYFGSYNQENYTY